MYNNFSIRSENVAEHLTEEEQLETLKRWWADNGRSVVAGIALAVLGYFGWQFWQSEQQERREAASILYQQLSESLADAQNLSADQLTAAQSIAEELKEDYSGLLYAADAALLMAGAAVQQGDLELAEQHLRWIVEQNTSEEMSLLARLRLAQVLYGQEDYEQGMSVLAQAQETGAYAAAYAELRGDLLLAQNQPAQAQAAYQSALEQLLPEQNARRDIIQMKLDDIQVQNVAQADEAQAQ
ncbi:tetratricopeptide repeat protein [Proteobacteria bacterium 005FR1]|nr:tetratricopeptide repeat protein [Proteobacteria bacterium 005FR1]